MYTYKIEKILKIVDGDTVDVSIDLGFNITIKQRVRLKGVNSAETKTKDLEEKKRGMDAKLWLEKELSKKGDWIIETYKEDKYGRILGILYCIGDPVTINEKMLNEGVAVPYL